jgi:tRNA U34 2-thiouridine synthase MnmA/TrmU
VELLRGLDETKDQSYFLYRLRQDQLDRVLFPVGELRKTDVRAIAESLALPNAKKKDSTGICFIGERPFREFLSRYLKTQPGPICTPDGVQVGRHQGLSFFTLGQRKGIGVASPLHKQAYVVVAKRPQTNELVVAIESGGLLDVLAHPNTKRYPNQRLLVVTWDSYAYLVPYVEEGEYFFLKTVIPSRKATREYLKTGDPDDAA